MYQYKRSIIFKTQSKTRQERGIQTDIHSLEVKFGSSTPDLKRQKGVLRASGKNRDLAALFRQCLIDDFDIFIPQSDAAH